jgi:hypothetical protein
VKLSPFCQWHTRRPTAQCLRNLNLFGIHLRAECFLTFAAGTVSEGTSRVLQPEHCCCPGRCDSRPQSSLYNSFAELTQIGVLCELPSCRGICGLLARIYTCTGHLPRCTAFHGKCISVTLSIRRYGSQQASFTSNSGVERNV